MSEDIRNEQEQEQEQYEEPSLVDLEDVGGGCGTGATCDTGGSSIHGMDGEGIEP